MLSRILRPLTLSRILGPLRDERGNSVIEYALILSLIAMVCLVGVTALGHDTKKQLTSSAASIVSSSATHHGE